MRRVLLLVCALVALAACTGTPPAAGPAGGATAEEAATAPPVRVTIPAIGVDSTLIPTGLQPDDSPEVPAVTNPGQASWATWSPAPGEIGPAVLLGHVDGIVDGRRGVPGVFAHIDRLTPGQEILVDRADGTQTSFTVTRAMSWPKSEFNEPLSAALREAYGDTTGAELRLVTCDGPFDQGERSYRDQLIVFATAR